MRTFSPITTLQIVVLLIAPRAFFSYLIQRFFKQPATTGVMPVGLLLSLSLVGAAHCAP